MYKVLLVDDEILTRQAIARNTHWGEADFELIGAAENGKEAIEILEKDLPDLILTDICMPVMDGLELSEYVHEHHPQIKVVIISGYDDFDYAKRALKYEVVDYILKPITSFELLDELLKIKDKLDSTREKQVQVEKIQKEYRKNMPTLRKVFLGRLLEGSYMKNDIDVQMEHFGIDHSKAYQCVALIELEDAAQFWKLYPESKEDLVEFSIGNIAGELTEKQENVLFLQNAENQSVLIFQGDSPKEIKNQIEEIGRNIMDSIWQFMKIKVSIMVGVEVTDPLQWSRSYQSALRARESKFLLDEYEFVYEKDFGTAQEKKHIQTAGWVEKLVLMIKLDQAEEISREVHDMFKEFRATGLEKKTILLHVQNMVLTILINLEENTPSLEKEEQEVEFIHHLSEYKHLSDVEERFVQFCKVLAQEIAGRRESENQKQAVLALDYIEKNYMNVNMSLNMVCTYLSVSTSYFSTIFKNATGETFVEALTRIRMEKAKKLLDTTNMKSYEVALSVGYNDPHYFSSIFKKHMGMTPTEYAKKLRGSGN